MSLHWKNNITVYNLTNSEDFKMKMFILLMLVVACGREEKPTRPTAPTEDSPATETSPTAEASPTTEATSEVKATSETQTAQSTTTTSTTSTSTSAATATPTTATATTSTSTPTPTPTPTPVVKVYTLVELGYSVTNQLYLKSNYANLSSDLLQGKKSLISGCLYSSKDVYVYSDGVVISYDSTRIIVGDLAWWAGKNCTLTAY